MNRITKPLSDKQALLLSGGITIWMSLAFFLFQQVSYETKDDPAMAQMVYGLNGSYYDPHLIYSNILLGYFLKGLLIPAPSVAWYTVIQAAVIMLGFFVLIYLFLARLGTVKGLLSTGVLVLFFGADFYLSMQFTKTAGLATVAGVLLLFDAVMQTDKQKSIWKYLLGGILTLLGSLYRFYSFGMVLIPLFGIGVALMISSLKSKDWKAVLRICLPFVIVFVTCFGCRLYDTWEYSRSEEWTFYKEYNSLRSNLLDFGFPDYEENEQLYQSLNISYADYRMFASWDHADPEVFSNDVMRQLVEAKPPRVIVWEEFGAVLSKFFFGYFYSIALWIAVAVALLLFEKKHAASLVFALISAIGVQVYLFLRGRFHLSRVNIILMLAIVAATILYGWQKPFKDNVIAGIIKAIRNKRSCSEAPASPDHAAFAAKPVWAIVWKTVTVLLAVAVCLCPFANFQPKTETPRSTPLLDLTYSTPDTLYFVRTAYTLPWIPTGLHMYPVGYLKNYGVLGGWRIHTAANNERWAAFSITNPLRDMVDNPDVMLIAGEDIVDKVRYINAHYSPDATAKCVRITEDHYSVYRITTTDGPLLNPAQAVSANGMSNIHHALSVTKKDDTLVFEGHLFADNVNSFGADVYLSVTDSSGNEQLYYTTQVCSDAHGDYMNGRYGAFFATPKYVPEGAVIKLYLETPDTLYRLDVGAFDQLIGG